MTPRTPLEIVTGQTLILGGMGWASLFWQPHPIVSLTLWILVFAGLLWWGNNESKAYRLHRKRELLQAEIDELQRLIDELLKGQTP